MNQDPVKRAGWQCAANLVPDTELLQPGLEFFGPCPIERAQGREDYFASVLNPIAAAFSDPVKQPYIFVTGIYHGQHWAAATGNITGDFTGEWLGLRGNGAPLTLRFGEFYRFEGSAVAEIRCLYDILGLAAQCGFEALPPFGGRDIIPPGPRRGAGLHQDSGADPGESQSTFDLVMSMINGCNRLVGSDLASQGLDTYWHDDMVWHGPWGIGSSEGLKSFYECAQGPSVRSFPNRRGKLPKTCFIAEGRIAAQTGWPALVGSFTGEPFRGIPPTGNPIGQNVMDFYVRDGDQLAENWVLIDLIGFARQCGVDLTAAWRDEMERVPAA